MPTLLFTGPGGAGTTTLAAAAAVRSAREGRRTVLISRQVPGVPGLDDVGGLRVVRAGGQAGLERLWAQHAERAAAALPLLSLPPASSVPALPGMAELALLGELAAAGSGAAADVVVLDGGPVESGTALVALPAALRWWLDHLLPARLRVLGTLRAAALEPESAARTAADSTLAGLAALEAALDRLPLADPAQTAVVLVAPGRASAVPVLRSAATALGLHGQRPAAVAVRVLPEGPGDWWAARVDEQQEALRGLGEVGAVREVPEAPVAPADADELAALAIDLPASEDAAAELAPEEVAGGWRLTVALPFGTREIVELTRWGDDLVITAAGSRRSIRLDSLLRRCQVTSGTLKDPGTVTARLEVGFAPDPQQWPADLLNAHERRAAEEGS